MISDSGESANSLMSTDSKKSVKFSGCNENVEVKPEHICSTADFLLRSGGQWTSIAKAFNCEDNGGDEHKRMEELLELCSWDYAESVSSMGSGTDDEGRRGSASDLSSHSLAYFEKNHEDLRSSDSRVSSLRLSSLLKLDSRPKLIARRKSVKVYENCFPEEDKEKLEDAFQGIIVEDNCSNKENIMTVKDEKAEVEMENVEAADSSNFWDDVVF